MRRATAALARFASLVMIGLSVFPSSPALAGSVFVSGHDADFHAFLGLFNAAGAQHLIQQGLNFARDGNTAPVLFLKSNTNNIGLGDHTDSEQGLIASGYTLGSTPGNHYVIVDSIQFATAGLSLYSALFVPSDHGGILTGDDLAALNARFADILNYLNAGGGLVAFAEDGFRTGAAGQTNFGFLPFLVSAAALSQSESGFTLSAFGTSLGLANTDINGNFSHNIFTGTGGMTPIDFDAQGNIVSLGFRGQLGQGGVVPEPGTLLLLGSGLAGLAGAAGYAQEARASGARRTLAEAEATMRTFLAAVLTVSVFLAAASAVRAASFSAVDDFSTVTNTETSTWSYRFATDLVRDGVYSSLTTFSLGGLYSIPYWNAGSFVPGIGVNTTGGSLTSGSATWPNNTVWMHPGSVGLVDVSWLSPVTGLVDVDFTVADVDPGATAGSDGIRWFVDLNTTGLASGVIPNAGPSVTMSLQDVPVSVGDRIHFIVDPGLNGNNTFDHTTLVATISPVPEPATLFLIGGSLVALGAMRGRKRFRKTQGVWRLSRRSFPWPLSSPAPVPEPTAFLLVRAGLVGLVEGRERGGASVRRGLLIGRALLTVAGAALFAIPPPASGQALSPEEIMRRSYFVSRVRDSESRATITLVSQAGQQRIRRVHSLTKLREDGARQMRVARFLYPPDVKGTATLMIEHSDRDDDMWIYLPAMGKVRRLVSANKRDSYVGTDFTYGDILGHRVEDYTHRLVGSEVVGGAECFVVESLPVSDKVRRESGYGKQVSWVRKDNFVAVRMEGYDLQTRLFKRLVATDVRLVDPALGRWQPMRVEMVNLQTGHRTVLSYDEFTANVGAEETFFTTRYLEKEY